MAGWYFGSDSMWPFCSHVSCPSASCVCLLPLFSYQLNIIDTIMRHGGEKGPAADANQISAQEVFR